MANPRICQLLRSTNPCGIAWQHISFSAAVALARATHVTAAAGTVGENIILYRARRDAWRKFANKEIKPYRGSWEFVGAGFLVRVCGFV